MDRIITLVTIFSVLSLGLTHSQPDTVLNFLKPFIGDWHSAGQGGLPWKKAVGFRFTWADDTQTFLRFYEGIPNNVFDKRILESLIVANPHTGIAEFLGYQRQNDFLFKGSFEPLEKGLGFIRLYQVYYPQEIELPHPYERNRGMKFYRDVCKLTGDTLVCITEQWQHAAWHPWGQGIPYKMVRSEFDHRGNKYQDMALASLEGSWISSLDPKYANHPMVKKFNPELKPQKLVIHPSSDTGFYHLTIYDIDRPQNGDTTLVVQGFIVPDGLGGKSLLEYNVQSQTCYNGYYHFDKDQIIREFSPCNSNQTVRYREKWMWNPDKKSFHWHTASWNGDTFQDGGVVVAWSKLKKS